VKQFAEADRREVDPLIEVESATTAESAAGPGLPHRAVAELVGTAFLVAAVIGSGIAAQRLSPGDVGLQLLENAIATGAALTALIIALQPISSAFNPVVTALERLTGAITGRQR
jgi:glycerol uptake facilitator-like aquaporin